MERWLIDLGQMSGSTYILAGTAALSGFLFGFDTSVVAASLVNIRSDLGAPLSDIQKEWIGASTSVRPPCHSPPWIPPYLD